jgi:predicted amidohydrolase
MSASAGSNGHGTERTIRVAAIQPLLRVGEMEWNMARCEDLVRRAAKEHSPDVIILPEGFTSPNVFDPACRAVPVPVDGPPYQLLRRLAQELGCVVGGGYLSVRGENAKHTYVLAEPDGTTNLHDKDEPSVWENAFYTGGDDDGVLTTSLGTVGCAMGWETARSRTARRLRRARVQLLLGGCCWPAYPNWVFPRPLLNRDADYYKIWAQETTANLARAVGVPTALAWHVGDVGSRTPLMPGVPWNTHMTGETQIVERDGRILARLAREDGEGYIAADVVLAEPEPLDPIPAGFWLRPQVNSIHIVWHYMKWHGIARYRIAKAAHRFPWQKLTGHDIPNHNPAVRPGGTVDLRQAEALPAPPVASETASS